MIDPAKRSRSIRPVAASLLAAIGLISLPAQAWTAGGEKTSDLDASRRSSVIEKTLELLTEKYVFPDVAEQMAKSVREKAASGGYSSIGSPSQLAGALTADLQAVSHDLHLRILHEPKPSMFETEDEPDADTRGQGQARAKHENYGFARVERLACNVGYIDLRNFHSVEDAGATASAAMNLVANTEALIIDLRKNGGGDPAMVALISSYLFGTKPVHLNSLYWREGDKTNEFWTLEQVPGMRTPDKPVFVLTSGYTFSAAEEFTYNLKCLGRATIVGETTGGGAHPGGAVKVDDEFAVWIPMGRAINPITGTNWEGTGVEPDVSVPARVALEMAHMLALEGLQATVTESWRLSELETELERVRGRIDELASPR